MYCFSNVQLQFLFFFFLISKSSSLPFKSQDLDKDHFLLKTSWVCAFQSFWERVPIWFLQCDILKVPTGHGGHQAWQPENVAGHSASHAGPRRGQGLQKGADGIGQASLRIILLPLACKAYVITYSHLWNWVNSALQKMVLFLFSYC